MSSADNHKKRSRRGYQRQKTILAPTHSPLIAADKYAQRKRFREFVKRLKLGRQNKREKDS
jgi:hypothetical protein